MSRSTNDYDQKDKLIALAIVKARKDFWTFCTLLQADLFLPRTNVLKPIADALQEAVESDKEIYRIGISIFPRSGKSTTVNYFKAWCLGNDPYRSILFATYGSELSESHTIATKTIMEMPLYKVIFPDIPEKTRDTKNKITFEGGHRESLYGTSVGGASTGLGGEILISDDLYKDFQEAMSEKKNQDTIDWYESTFRTRLDKKRKIEIVIGTRWRVGELADKMETNGDFDRVIKIPALVTNRMVKNSTTGEFQLFNPNYKEGEMVSVNEHIMTTETLHDYKRTMSEYIFDALYQQKPMTSLNTLFKSSHFMRVRSGDYEVLNRVAIIDTKTTGRDYFVVAILSAVVLNGDDEEKQYILVEDILFTNDVLKDDNKLQQRIFNFINFYRPAYTFIETNHDYSMSTQIKNYCHTHVVRFRTKRLKQYKILANATFINHMILREEGIDGEYDSAIKQLFLYDYEILNQHDDVPDALAMGAIKIREYKRKIGFNGWDDIHTPHIDESLKEA